MGARRIPQLGKRAGGDQMNRNRASVISIFGADGGIDKQLCESQMCLRFDRVGFLCQHTDGEVKPLSTIQYQYNFRYFSTHLSSG